MFHKICIVGAIVFMMTSVDAGASVCTSLSYGDACKEWYGLDLTGWESQPQYAKSVCGTNAFDGANGFEYRYSNDAYDDGCFCNLNNDPHMVFYWGVGCFCEDGYYNYSDSSTKCEKCPSDYPFSDGFKFNEDGSGYASNWSNGTDPCYRRYNVSGINVNLGLKEYIYGSSFIESIKCDAGYYYYDYVGVGNEYDDSADYFCGSVGKEYYSSSNNSRLKCPTYINAAGESVVGQTSGAGTGADDITDCAIPESEQFVDASGIWVYAGGCNYSN